MKTLRILVLLLLPALGFVGCSKSTIKPDCTVETTTTNDASVVSGSASRTSLNVGASVTVPSISNVVASGDSDRDGGDKKNKKR